MGFKIYEVDYSEYEHYLKTCKTFSAARCYVIKRRIELDRVGLADDEYYRIKNNKNEVLYNE